MRSTELGEEDSEDVEEEENIAGDAEEAGQVGDPLHPPPGKGEAGDHKIASGASTARGQNQISWTIFPKIIYFHPCSA